MSELPNNLKRVLRQRMMSLLDGKYAEESDCEKTEQFIQNAFASFADQKRKELNLVSESNIDSQISANSLSKGGIGCRQQDTSRSQDLPCEIEQQLNPNDEESDKSATLGTHSKVKYNSPGDKPSSSGILDHERNRKSSKANRKHKTHKSLNRSPKEKKRKHSRSHSPKKKKARSRSPASKKRHKKSKDGERNVIDFEELGVDRGELEEFIENFAASQKPSTASSSSSYYRSTFKRHSSPPVRKRDILHRRESFEKASEYFAKKTSNRYKSWLHRDQLSSEHMPGTVHNSGKKSLKELTDICRKIAEDNRDQIEDSKKGEPGDNECVKFSRNVGKTIRMNIKDGREIPAKSTIERLKSAYPVSTGLEHMGLEKDDPVVISNRNFRFLIQRRLDAVKMLSENPNDGNAVKIIEECDTKIANWASTPGSELDPNIKTYNESSTQGETLAVQGPDLPSAFYTIPPSALPDSLLPISHPSYLQMIAQKKADIGKKLLEKHGWREGCGLGKNMEGKVEPILLDVKLDRKGLTLEEDPPLMKKIAPIKGKHPVSYLQEICSKNHWGAPDFDLVETQGPPHRQSFIMKVKVRGVVYQPTSSSPTKKEAKALAAILCLQTLGIMKDPAGNI